MKSGSGSRDVVVQLTKMGLVFVLDRETGQPVFPVAEVPVPHSDVPGEETSPTQPVPLKPPPLARMTFDWRDNDMKMSEYCTKKIDEIAKFRGSGNGGPTVPAIGSNSAGTFGAQDRMLIQGTFKPQPDS